MAVMPASRIARRVEREARALVREARRGLRGRGDRVPPGIADRLRLGADTVEAARTGGDGDALRDELVRLDELVNEHLAFTRKSPMREYVESIGAAVIIALLLRAFVLEAFKIPSGSMYPTMEVGDHLFVNKVIYGLRLPFSDTKIFDWHQPARGDVIVFRYPCDGDKDYIKRVVAVAGDTVEVRCDELLVNGKPVRTTLADAHVTYWDYNGSGWDPKCQYYGHSDHWGLCPSSAYVEHLPSGRTNLIYYDADRPAREERRAQPRPGASYWSYLPSRIGRSEERLYYAENDFPSLPPPVAADALAPDETSVEPSGPDKFAAVRRLLGGESATTLAHELSARYQKEPWCRIPDCLSAADVLSWLPDPASCKASDGEITTEDRYAARTHLKLAPADQAASPCGPKVAYVVPDGHVFAMGDNRENSKDSRKWGSVPIENIKGKALFIWWSQKPDRAGGILWQRVGKIVR